MREGVHKTIDGLFKREYGKMVAVLTKLLGMQHLQTAHDLVQDSLLQALNTWSYNGLPANPSAWLHRVCKNKEIDFLRRNKTFQQQVTPHILQAQTTVELGLDDDSIFTDHYVQDSQLQMIFACCHPSIPVDSQLALALKTLCGLSIPEIASAFLLSEETISKRIYRAKEKIRAENIVLEMPVASKMAGRIDAVLHCLYLVFNEGYNSAHHQQIIRHDLCEEAMHLAFMLTYHPKTNLPRTNALLALFCYQTSRLPARTDGDGNIILLQQQDRSLWYQPLIVQGNQFMEQATNKEMSVYHLEAAIAYFHAAAPTFQQTNWTAIYKLYVQLHHNAPNPFVALNKAIAALYAVGGKAALQELQAINVLDQFYLYHIALGDVYLHNQSTDDAIRHFQQALSLTRSATIQQLLHQKIGDALVQAARIAK